MGFLEKMFGASLRLKVLVPVIAVMIGLLTVTVFIVDGHFQQQMETNSRLQQEAARLRFQESQTQHKIYLQRRFQSLARGPAYRSTFTLQKDQIRMAAIRDKLEQMFLDEELSKESVAFIFFTPQLQNVSDKEIALVQQNNLRVSPAALRDTCGLAVKNSLQGDSAFDTVRLKNQLFNVVSIPISDGNQIVGALTFGEKIEWSIAQEFGIGSGSHVYSALIAGDSVIPSTMPVTNIADADLVVQFRRLTAASTVNRSAMERTTLGNEHFFCSSGNFLSLKEDQGIGYLLFTSYEDQLTTMAETRNLLMSVSLVAILIGSLVIWLIVWRATWPLSELRDGAESVGRGDFSRRVPIHSRDECGKLAAVFNQMTENIQQSQAKLQQTVSTLKNTQAQLLQSEKLSAVGEFVAGVAHELNNPLAAVMGFSEILKEAKMDEKHRHHLDLIFKSATRCQKIVQALLSFARRHQPERKPVSINNLIGEVLEIITYQLRSSNVEIIQHLAPNLQLVLADGHQIQQVLLNLLNNARQAIEAHQPAGCITITTEVKNHFLRVAVRDNGPGIAPENLNRVFDPFFTTKEVGKGTGLGLSLCYGLIKEHGGNITVTSRLGEGTTFTIELPVPEDTVFIFDSTPASTATHPSDPNEGAGKKILVVDDEEILLHMIRDDLTQHGYTVVTADTGESALRELHQNKFDAILCDIKMPGLNGRQVFDWIRASRPTLAHRLLFMTGDIINNSLQIFLEENRLTCLNKPFVLADLHRKLKQTINENR